MKEPRRVFTFTRELVFIKTPEKVWDVTHERKRWESEEEKNVGCDTRKEKVRKWRRKKIERIQVRGERKRPAWTDTDAIITNPVAIVGSDPISSNW
jgi:hypothetical protein